MKYNKLINVLFSTKNYSAILSEINKLSLQEKQVILTYDKVSKRLAKIADISLLNNILIDLPYEFRIKFLSLINIKEYNYEYEKIIIEFLKLQNYEDFDHKKLSKFQNIKDKQLLALMFRKFSPCKLKNIILANYNQYINDYAFLEFSKKTPNLNLESNVVNNVCETVLFSELKKRKLKQKSTNIDIKEFTSLTSEKQNNILLNGDLGVLEKEIIKAYLEKNDINEKQQLIDRFKISLENFSYIKLIEMQTIIYNIDEKTAIELIKLFFINILKFENDIEQKYLASMIFNFKKLNHKTAELFEISKKKPFTVINYLNTGIINPNLDSMFHEQITIEQYQKINIKKINKINKLINTLYSNNTAIQKDWGVISSYKLYLIFGYENSIELLSEKFGKIDYSTLGQLINKCNVKDVKLNIVNNCYEPALKKEFVQFLIGDKKDNNTTLKRILRGELDIIKNEFANIYNNFERYQQAIGKMHLNKLLPLLQENPFLLLPNEYKLTKDIIDNIIKSYGYVDILGEQNNDNAICVKKACDFYHNYLEKRIVSSIPRVIGNTDDNYKYEVLKLDDPIIMTLGYQTGCCFRLNGMSKDFLRYCSESIYARVIVIRNEFDEICSMIPIIRNGNVIVGNSIETNSKADTYKGYSALKKAYDNILKISNHNETKPIIACLVSNLHSNCYSNKVVGKKIYPIRNISFYTNYDSQTYIVSIQENKNEKDFKLYSPDAIYYDERPEILVYNWKMRDIAEKIEVEKRVKSILYKLNKKDDRYTYFSKYIICSEDWFLKVDFDGISGEYLEKDPRAKEEFDSVKKYLETKLQNKKVYEVDFEKSDVNNDKVYCSKSKKLILEKNNTFN